MLSLEKRPGTLGSDNAAPDDRRLTAEQIDRVRSELYPLAQLVVELYRAQLSAPEQQTRNWARVTAALDPAERMDLDERAAIVEFEGGHSRDAAEQRALASWLADRK